MARTLEQIDAALAAAELRLKQVDGVGLADPNDAELATLAAKVAGTRQAMLEAVKILESTLADYRKQVGQLQTQLQNHLNS